MSRAPLPREHGTRRGYDQHTRNREPACGACLAATAKQQESYRWRGKCAPGLGWPLQARALPGETAAR